MRQVSRSKAWRIWVVAAALFLSVAGCGEKDRPAPTVDRSQAGKRYADLEALKADHAGSDFLVIGKLGAPRGQDATISSNTASQPDSKEHPDG